MKGISMVAMPYLRRETGFLLGHEVRERWSLLFIFIRICRPPSYSAIFIEPELKGERMM